MRGNYNITHDDRRKLFCSLLQLCKDNCDEVDLIGTQLSLCNCLELMGELGYEAELQHTGGWEGETWWTCEQDGYPSVSFWASAYAGDLDMYWTGRDDGEEIETEKLKELMRENWGKYFPVI